MDNTALLKRLAALFFLTATVSCLSVPISCIFLSCSHSKKVTGDGNWKLVWSDEFNYSGLPDSGKWNDDVGGHGWGNNEKQFYLKNSPENSCVKGGQLHIVALKKNIRTCLTLRRS